MTSIPYPSLSRLPQYHHLLIELKTKGIRQVSCSTIGAALNLVPVQVRKDLQYTGIVGKPKTGYSVDELVQAIESFLGWNNVNETFLAGADNLGTALLGHERFSRFGLSIVAAFDTDPRKIGQWIHEKAVLPLDKLADLAQRMSIHLGIITAPAEVAQSIADEMVKGASRRSGISLRSDSNFLNKPLFTTRISTPPSLLFPGSWRGDSEFHSNQTEARTDGVHASCG